MIYAIALSPDDRYLAVGGYLDSGPREERIRIRIHRFPHGQVLRVLKSHTNVVQDLAFSPDGRYLVSGSSDETVKVWDVHADFRLVHTFDAHQDSVYAVRVFKHGPDYRIVSAGLDHQVLLYSLKQKAELARFSHDDKAHSLAVGPDFIASAGWDRKIHIFDRDLKHQQTIPSETEPTGLAVSPDGRLLLAGTGDHPLICNVYDRQQGFKRIASFSEHDNLTEAVAFLDANTAVTAGGDNCDIYFWNPRTGQMRGHGVGQGKTVWAVGLSGERVGFGNTFDYRDHNHRGPLEKGFDLSGFETFDLREKEAARFQRISRQYKDFRLSHAKGGPYGLDEGVLRIQKGETVRARIVRDGTNGYRHRTYGFTPGGTILSGGSNGHLKAYDRRGHEIADFVGHTGEVWSIATDGPWLVSGSDDQTIKLWDLEKLKAMAEKLSDKDEQIIRLKNLLLGSEKIAPSLSLFVSADNEWVVWTPEGFYDASPDGAKFVGYHVNQGKARQAKYLTVDQLHDLFHRPDLVAKRWQGGHEEEIQAELARIGDIESVIKSGLPPELVLLTESEIKLDTPDFLLKLNIRDQGGGIGKIVCRVNGQVIGSPEGARPVHVLGAKGFQKPLTLENGENFVTVAAYNAEGTIRSKEVPLKVTVDDPLAREPDLYALAVGISQYKYRDLQLQYAAPDARDFAAELAKRARPLFNQVDVRTLLDEQASLAGIESAFDRLSKQVKASDVFVLFLAGHGMAVHGKYHFFPWELGFENRETVRKNSLSQEKIQDLTARIKALKSLIILDTCSSGSFGPGDGVKVATRGLEEKTAIDKLMRATGRATLAATSRTQQALEGHQGHGVFTHALLQGLRKEADQHGNQNGATAIDELADFLRQAVPEITHQRFGYRQMPMQYLHGAPFPIGCREGFDGPGCGQID